MPVEEKFVVEHFDSSSSSDLELVIDQSNVNKKETQDNKDLQIEAQNIFEYDIDHIEDKPWNKPGADITDYFNYGFNETTWKEYCNMQKNRNDYSTYQQEWNDGKYSGVKRGYTDLKRTNEWQEKEMNRRPQGDSKRRYQRTGGYREDRGYGMDRDDRMYDDGRNFEESRRGYPNERDDRGYEDKRKFNYGMDKDDRHGRRRNSGHNR